MSKKMNSFKGRLTPAQISDGMNAARENAARLSRDAELLLQHGSFATALSIAALSIEEAGKIPILRSMSVASSDEEIKDCWRDYRSHTRKNVAWALPELVAKGARKLDQLRPLFSEDAEHPFVLDQLEQLGFYTDCLGNAHWAKPDAVVSQELAQAIVSIAKVFSRPQLHSVREVELWVTHVGPVWRQDIGLMKQALMSWWTAMHAEGLSTSKLDDVRDFVLSA